MPDLRVGERSIAVSRGDNLLDALLRAGVAVAYSCRAGSCQACAVRCVSGEPLDDKPDALDNARRAEGWRLACQCRVMDDLQIQVFDPRRDARPAQLRQCDWLSDDVLRLRLEPQQPLIYQAGQHLLLWTSEGIARSYSLASLAGEDAYLEFHIDCAHPGAFSAAARQLRVGDRLGLGALSGGSLHYDPTWQDRPLWLLGAGTGLAPLYAILREALRQEHRGPIRVIHVARSAGEHYLAETLAGLAAAYPELQIELIEAGALTDALARLRPTSRQTMALLCGRPANVEVFARRLYLAGLPRSQVFSDTFLPHA